MPRATTRTPGTPSVASAWNVPEREQSLRRKTQKSAQRYRRAQASLAGGVSSGMRRSARPYPLFFESGHGSRVCDVDGNSYIDYGLAWGPLILGHTPAEVTKAIATQVGKSLTFGAQHDLEFEVAELLKDMIPVADMVGFANSGTEIVQVALRLARAYTRRQRLVKFEGHYHGWADDVLVSYHPTQEQTESFNGDPVPVGKGQKPHPNISVAVWNDRAGVEEIFARHGDEISAVICEPMLCNSGCIPPQPGFLEFLREITRAHGALLIFDEVITGFRLGLGGAQEFYGVTPDLATYAKALGSGVPVSALAGREEIMRLIAQGEVIHAGTLNGNGLVLAATKATLQTLSRFGQSGYQALMDRGERLRQGLEQLLVRSGEKVAVAGCGSVFQISFMSVPALNYRQFRNADKARYSDFALAMLDEGVLVLPDGRWYLSFAHSDEDIEVTLQAAARVVNGHT